METVFVVGAIVWGLALLVVSLWILSYAFQDSILWGLACLFIPLAMMVYCFHNWEECKKPFWASILLCFLCIPLFFMAYELEMKKRAANAPPPLPAYVEPQ